MVSSYANFLEPKKLFFTREKTSVPQAAFLFFLCSPIWPPRRHMKTLYGLNIAHSLFTVTLSLRSWWYCVVVEWDLAAEPFRVKSHSNFFLERVDHDWANAHYFCRLFYTEKSWHAYWFSAVYLWSAWFSLWCESRAFLISLTYFET